VTVAERLRQFVQVIDRHVPDRVPRLSGAAFTIFRVLWSATFLLAIIGPIAGLWMRYNQPTQNSQLMLGSRAGFAVSREDATLVRFTVGPESRKAGIVAGDHIVAISGTQLRHPVPISERALVAHGNDPDYLAVAEVLFGTAASEVPLLVRDPDGRIRDVTVKTGEQHIDAAAREHHVSPKLLSFVDIMQVFFYPVLLWVAFNLYMRNSDRPVPSLLSFAILLSMASEQPSSVFLQSIEVPRVLNVAMYDLGNVSLLGTVLLFPDARLRPRAIFVALSVLPVLFFLHGTAYQLMFVCVFVVGMIVFVRRLRAEAGPASQQLKLLFLGLAGYPVFRGISIFIDYTKWKATSFPQQLVLETLAGAAFALAIVSLYLVLFSALRQHRLYDADALFSRSAMIAALTLTIAAFFGAASAGLQAAGDVILGQNAGPWPTIVAGGVAVLLINPVQTRIYRVTKRVFQKDLFKLRTELPKRMDDLRETASAAHLLQVAVREIVPGLRATRAAATINGRVVASVGQDTKDVRQWIRSTELPDPPRLTSNRQDHLFPLRLPLCTATPSLIGWIILGPRPDGSLYSRDERQALLEVQESISRAVEVARQREQAQSAERRWRKRQEERMAALEERLTSLVATSAPRKKLRA
jgi:post-segregation antitoxin (ccd killing protein)